LNIKPCMGQISGTWEILLCEYWRKSMIIGEKNTDLKRLTGRLKLRFLTKIGRFHWNQGEEVAHFAWFGEPWHHLCSVVWLWQNWSNHKYLTLLTPSPMLEKQYLNMPRLHRRNSETKTDNNSIVVRTISFLYVI
jgi:hypothetical protein